MRGVFWIIDGEICAYPFTDEFTNGISKSGNTYNHKKLWYEVRQKKCRYPYNYYPRGRVEITSKGKSVIYINPNVDESFVPEIINKFSLTDKPKIKHDYSEHYKCYLDEDWKADS